MLMVSVGTHIIPANTYCSLYKSSAVCREEITSQTHQLSNCLPQTLKKLVNYT